MNGIESAIVMSTGDTITHESLPPFLTMEHNDQGSAKSPRNLFEIERKAILDVLHKSGGNKAEAARRLGIGLRTLYRKLKQYGVDN
jgi:DNA-binding NtrC family response regulator